MTEFTPTTEQVRTGYASDPESEYRDPINYPHWEKQLAAAFDRWLARRDAEVAAKALEDAAGRLREMDEPWGVKLYGAFSAWLKGRSAALRASSLGAENPEMTGDES
jgi:hypothetical protein